jgi:hypothetical protein
MRCVFLTSEDLFKDFEAFAYTVDARTASLARQFDLVNVGLDTKYSSITLTVPEGQSRGPLSSAHIVTGVSVILPEVLTGTDGEQVFGHPLWICTYCRED